MGMAASQARLLTLTARLADNELRSQSINNAKMRLAAESSRASEDYINALNNATMMFTSYDQTGVSTAQPLTFNALTAYSSYNTQYGLVNSAGQLLVSEADAEAFKNANGDVNKFLEAKGLTFGTTYFEQVGGLSTSYPVPYNNIEPETLQTWYEELVAYQNSSELEEYDDIYAEYISAYASFDAKVQYPIEQYLTTGGIGGYTSGLHTKGDGATTDATEYDYVASMRRAYLGTATTDPIDYSINIYNLAKTGIISDLDHTAVSKHSLYKELDTLFKSYSDTNASSYNNGNGYYDVSGTKITKIIESPGSDLEIQSNPDPDDSTKTIYTIYSDLKITVDSTGKVTKLNLPGTVTATDPEEGVQSINLRLNGYTSANIGNIAGSESIDNPTKSDGSTPYTYPEILEEIILGYYTGSADSYEEHIRKVDIEDESGEVVGYKFVTDTYYIGDNARANALDILDSEAIEIIKSYIDPIEFVTYIENQLDSSIDPVILSKHEWEYEGKKYTWSNMFSDGFRDALAAYAAAVAELQGDTSTPLGRAINAMYGSSEGELSVVEYMMNYQMARESLMSFIFNNPGAEYRFPASFNEDGTVATYHDSCTIEKALSNGYITEEGLADLDYVLTLLKNCQIADSNGEYRAINTGDLTEKYNTVLKVSIVNSVIAENGEAKYAWIDANDTQNTGDADAKAQWYTNLFQRMQKGYKTLEDGLAASKQWIEYALEAGIVTMEQVDKSYNWNPLSYKTCIKITEVTDEAAVALAEAEYARAMNDIEAKDSAYDMQLKNIDTEHTALQTEYDVVKGVMNKNIERTFKFNQSA